MIASISRESPRGFSTSFYVKDDSPIKSVADLKGKIVGINGFYTSGHLWLKTALEKHGLTDTDVTITPVPFPAMQEALEAGKVDLGMFPQPFAALAEKQAKVRKIFDAKYGMPFEEELIVLIGKDEFLKKNAAAVRAFLEDLKASMQFYLEKPREARQLLIDHKMVRVNPDVYLSMNDYYRDPTLRVDVEALEKMQAVQIAAGFQKKRPTSGRWWISVICRNELARECPQQRRCWRSPTSIRRSRSTAAALQPSIICLCRSTSTNSSPSSGLRAAARARSYTSSAASSLRAPVSCG
jgi:ABC-type nitrate/sulfonate/bicarbonate transport system substrate-binding protein